MFCKNCGKKLKDGVNFCNNCGKSIGSSQDSTETNKTESRPFSQKSKSKISKKVIIAIVIVLWISYNAYTSIENDAVNTNNNGLSSFESGNSQQAINQFKDASNNAVSTNDKITTLKNLAFVYETEGQRTEALSAFQEALKLTSQGSFDYYLISGEMSLLEGRPSSAYSNYEKAYEIDPENFQINNSLAIFHMNLDGSSPDYEDYPKALTYAAKAYSLAKSEITRQNLGIAYYFNENYNEAISMLSQSDSNKFPYVSLWLGLAYYGKEDYTNAKYYLQKAVNSGVDVPQEVTDYLNSN